ncbi:hypothetical protein MNBD_GAMMA12-606 [hydrothermal vent metagenome]|uniref:Death on curing protein, Doc toxin n=1 Tax=hydrothermal vent metagenome TaxID=652676 RepID=A0A3B0YMW6_9ZZZZ
MVIWSEPAKLDLRSIHDFIAHNSHYYAKKVTHDILDKMNILDELPKAGKVVQEIADESIREVSIYSFRLIYEIKGQTIYVLAIIHKRQNFTSEQLDR